MRRIQAVLLITMTAVGTAAPAMGYDAETYSSKCGFSVSIPKGSAGKIKESKEADGTCVFELEEDDVEFYAATVKDPSVSQKDLEKLVVEETEIAAEKWTKFDEGKKHIGYKATDDEQQVYAAAENGETHSCVAVVAAEKGESEDNLKQFYKSLKCS